ncbi:MAG: arginase [Anaerolineales bacterium]|jgi:arginase|nr:arginase [Chloroflexota bacterium]MBK6644375.1 arginase [Anaerolineales bacterium]MCC6985874.1 arginase [Anaerolineales bacterium]
MQIDVIGVPIDLGADRRGVDMGPSAIRYAHLQPKLESLGYTVNDEGNVEVPIAEMCSITNPKLKYIDCIIPMSRRVSGAVSTSAQAGNFPLVIGGDHSLSIGSVRGAARNRKIGVIWLDAHGDFNTAETTPSGNIHGMSLAILAGLGDKSLVQLWDEPVPVIDPKKIAIVGARDLDEGEKVNLQNAGSMVMGMEQIDRYGMVTVLEKAIERVSRDVDGIYLSLDLDSLDPEHAPGVGTPVPAGLTQREAHLACEMIAETGKLIGMDLVEVNPILDVQNRTALLAVDFALSALGRRIWNGLS